MEARTKTQRADKWYSEVIKLRKIGIQPGVQIFPVSLKKFYTVKKGCTTYIIGIPGHGKSQLLAEILLILSTEYNWKHFYWSPESGNETMQIADLMSKHQRKDFNYLTSDEFGKAFAFINHHFIFPDFPQMVSVNMFFEAVYEAVQTLKIDTVSVDPWNELNHDFLIFGGREDKYLSFTLGGIRHFSEVNNVHTFIAAHPRTMYEKQKDGKYAPPSFYQFSGGAEWANKAQSIICIHRESFTSNEAHIIFQKVKPKEIGIKGELIANYNLNTNRYENFRETNNGDIACTF